MACQIGNAPTTTLPKCKVIVSQTHLQSSVVWAIGRFIELRKAIVWMKRAIEKTISWARAIQEYVTKN